MHFELPRVMFKISPQQTWKVRLSQGTETSVNSNVEELSFLEIEGDRMTGEVQANVGAFGRFDLILNVLA